MDILSLIFLAVFFPLRVHAAIPPLPSLAMGAKSFGVLVLGEGEAPQWTKTADEIKTAFYSQFPVEFAFGLADKDSLQEAVNNLESKQVKKIVIVPLFLSSSASVMKQVRYLFGIGKNPSRSLFKTYQNLAGPPASRLLVHVPVALMPTLDFSPVFPKILTSLSEADHGVRARETLVLVSESPRASKNARDWKKTLEFLALKVRQAAGFKSDAVFLLDEGLSLDDAARTEAVLSQSLRKLRLESRVFVITTELAPDLLTQRLHKILSGLLVGYNEQTVLPDPLIVSWVKDAAMEGAKLGDMRRFKDKKKSGFMNFKKMEAQ